MNIKLSTALALCLAASRAGAIERDLNSDTWAATDALGRSLPMPGQVRAPRANKFAGIFYFLWHGPHGTPGPFDITKLLAANPANPQFGPPSAFHWWGEPEAGYYRATDVWVIRRNLSMLQDAGIDVLMIDVTNAFTYPGEVRALCDTARAMRTEGNRTPQVAFVSYSHSAATVQRLWNEFYSKNLYPELWFRWNGKPLLLAVRDSKLPDGKTLPDEILNFFTWRHSWAWDAGPGKWQWIDDYPQDPGLNEDGTMREQIPVAVASHPTRNVGRSFQRGKQPPIDRHALTPTWTLGLHFEEQWLRAHELDLPFVFVTGWNEWVAQRFVVDGPSGTDFLGRRTQKGDSFFVDAYNAEFNRDIEPVRGEGTDNHYYQLVSHMRRFKGVAPSPRAGSPQSIGIDGRFAEWREVKPEYRDTVGDTQHRDHAGWGTLRYISRSGRNDIVSARVSRDVGNVYFYAQTRAPLSNSSDPHWMRLFLDTDQNPRTGWNGYDVCVNHTILNDRESAVARWQNGAWRRVTRTRFAVRSRELELAVPRSVLGQRKNGSTAFDFHWTDNVPFDLNRWFVDGDSAPNRRFNYRYEAVPPMPSQGIDSR